MIQYRIAHHVPGRIRIEVPSLKGLTFEVLEGLSRLTIPCGIEGISPNPLTGSLVIKYNPAIIDIMVYLEEIAADRTLQEVLLKGDGCE
ncbi:MAG: HMA2 domain-containing protein [Dissulfurispiraceae bacterium]